MSGELFTDADLTHPWVQQYRIPLVSSPYPRWKYEVALVAPNDEPYGFWGEALWPTEEEARLIGCAIDFRRSWYNAGWAAKMLDRQLDVDSGTNTVILAKLPRGWVYRRATHKYGPPTWPARDAEQQFPDVEPLLDHVFDITDRWAAWKNANWLPGPSSVVSETTPNQKENT